MIPCTPFSRLDTNGLDDIDPVAISAVATTEIPQLRQQHARQHEPATENRTWGQYLA